MNFGSSKLEENKKERFNQNGIMGERAMGKQTSVCRTTDDDGVDPVVWTSQRTEWLRVSLRSLKEV